MDDKLIPNFNEIIGDSWYSVNIENFLNKTNVRGVSIKIRNTDWTLTYIPKYTQSILTLPNKESITFKTFDFKEAQLLSRMLMGTRGSVKPYIKQLINKLEKNKDVEDLPTYNKKIQEPLRHIIIVEE